MLSLPDVNAERSFLRFFRGTSEEITSVDISLLESL